MPQYRRTDQPGGTFFLTLVMYRRRPLLGTPSALRLLRQSLRIVRHERAFEVVAAVILPDHLHVIWTLPSGDAEFSSRVGRWKALFTRALRANISGGLCPPYESTNTASRQKHREGNVWQRRFWEHLIRDPDDLNQHLDYIHYNPVKHGYAACPHSYEPSLFMKWVRRDAYTANWLCTCDGRLVSQPTFSRVTAGDVD